jgi:heme/copper-type cytochrome/quinol oxidase subunit 2
MNDVQAIESVLMLLGITAIIIIGAAWLTFYMLRNFNKRRKIRSSTQDVHNMLHRH